MSSAIFWNVTQSSSQTVQEFSLDCLTLEDGADRLSRNVRKKLLLYAVYLPTRAQISTNAIIC